MVAMPEEEAAADEAHAFLRGHTQGELQFEENVSPLRFVFDTGGRPIAPVMYIMLEAQNTVLFVPEFAEGVMEVQVTLSALDAEGPEGALADRWRIYHGDPSDVRWARFDIDAARYGKWVIDGELLMRPNPLAGDEARLCRTINQAHRDRLGAVCRHFADADVEDPLVVGIDPLGFDVRRRFDIVRLPAPHCMETAAAVEATVAEMIERVTSS